MKKRRLMLALVVFTIVLFIPILVQADVGNSFSGGSGGGSFSGGYSGGYGGSYSGGSGLGGFFFFGGGPSSLISIVVLIVIFALISAMRNRNGSGGNTIPYRQSRRICDEAKALEEIRAVDPAFSADSFKTYVSEVYLNVQEAWEAKDWQKVRPFESNSLFNVHERQIQEYIDQKKTNHLDMQNIRDVTIAEFRQDGSSEVLSVRLEASLLDYVTDDESGKVIEGSKTRYQHRFYYLEFIRRNGIKTSSEHGLDITNCPNCGAPTKVTSSGECEYCHSIITNGDFGWVLNKYMAW